MKLTNLTLAVLVAVGVAACGGSDDNNSNNPTDKGNTNNRTTPTPKPDANNNQAQVQQPEDPRRAAPGNTVEDALKGDVAVAKTTYAEAGIRDLISGYAPNKGLVSQGTDPLTHDAKGYEPNSTDLQNIKRLSSRINYSETGQFRANANNRDYNGAVLANPHFTYALGKDNVWYRMYPVKANGTTAEDWAKTTPNTKYKPEPSAGAPATAFPADGVTQDKLFFIPNVKVDAPILSTASTTGLQTDATAGIKSGRLKITNDDLAANDTTTGDFDTNRNEVQFRSAVFNGRTYDLSRAGAIQKIDLNTIPVDPSKVQTLPVTLNYSVLDNKRSNGLNDDNLQLLTAKAGAMKAYNLPYSLAFVTVNQKGAENARYTDGARARNIFDYANTGEGILAQNGAYKVTGLQTPFLPRNGRADYNGKSFGADSIGDIHLRADFGETGSHINGTIANRTYADGRGALPEITLNNIQLSNPGNLNTTGTRLLGNAADAGTATARNANGTWDVQLYGPNAEEAGGFVRIDNDQVIPGGVEVFTSQRGKMIDHSNISNQ